MLRFEAGGRRVRHVAGVAREVSADEVLREDLLAKRERKNRSDAVDFIDNYR